MVDVVPYIPQFQRASAGNNGQAFVYDHATKRYVHGSFEASGAVAAHAAASDPHAGYLLAGGSRNGAATVVAANANATPLTLRMASEQVADGLRVRDASDGQLAYLTKDGHLGVGDFAYAYDDYGDGGGDETVFYAARNFTTRGRFADYAYLYGGWTQINIVDTSATGVNADAAAYGQGGSVIVLSGATYVPDAIFGLSYTAVNSSTQAMSGVVAAEVEVATNAADASLIGLRSKVQNNGDGTVAGAVAILARRPTINKNYTTLVGIDVEDFSTITNATTLRALRTRGGQVLHQAGSAATVPLVIQSAASPTADRIQVKNSTGTVEAGLDSAAKLFVGQTSATALVDIAASTTARASQRIRSGVAPTTPNDGDLWYDGTNLKFRNGSTTRTINWT